jgi:hypothetical protein
LQFFLLTMICGRRTANPHLDVPPCHGELCPSWPATGQKDQCPLHSSQVPTAGHEQPPVLPSHPKKPSNSPAILDLLMTSAYFKASTRRSMPRVQRCAEMIQPIRRIWRRLQAARERFLAGGGSQLPVECSMLFAYAVGG